MAPYFHTSGLNNNVLSYLGYFLIFLLIITLFSTFYYILKNNQNKYNVSAITDKEVIQKILDEILTYRIKIDLMFSGSSKNYISTTLIKFDENFLWIELPYYIKVNYMWVNKDIICFFKISKIDDLDAIYYHFKTKIVDSEMNAQKLYVLKVNFPDQIFLGQKRKFLRVKLPSEYVQRIQLWLASQDENSGFSTEVEQWGKPWAEYSVQDGQADIYLEDISGGGIRLGMKKKLFSQFKKLKDKSYLFLALEFNPELVPSRLNRLLFLAKLKKVYFAEDADYVFLGLEFLARAKLLEPTKIQWITLEENKGYEELVDWLFEKYLELYRKKLKEKDKLN